MNVPVREDLELVEGYHSPQADVSVRLNANESPFPPPEGWVEALREEVGRIRFNRYPDRAVSALRVGIAEHHGVGPDRVFAAKGSNEVIQCALLAFGGRGRKAVVLEPTYALHSHIARITGTGVVVGERRADFTTDLDEVRRLLAVTPGATVFLCSPNNPTGMAEREETVRAVLECSEGLVLVDEAYGQFAPWSALELLGSSPRLAVVRTFSKTWSMAAARLGYAVASPEVLGALERVALPYHVDSVAQAAGLLALRYEQEMRERVAAVVEERRRLAGELAAMPVTQWPSDSNFILFRPTERDGGEVWERLLERDVLVRNCSGWPRLRGCLRVTVGTGAENDAFLDALDGCLSGDRA